MQHGRPSLAQRYGAPWRAPLRLHNVGSCCSGLVLRQADPVIALMTTAG